MDESAPDRTTTLWHQAFYQLVSERRPPSSDVRTEVPLSQYPSRVDLLLIRRTGEPPRDSEARILRGLWPLLGQVTVADFKSPRRSFRGSELLRLCRYGMEYHEVNFRELAGPEALTLALFVPQVNKALREEIAMMRCTLEPISPGYARLTGGMLYNVIVVSLDQVADAEHDEYVRIFTRQRDIRDPHARHWIQQWLIGKVDMQDAKNMEGYDEMLQKLLASLPPEQVMAGYTADERLAGMSPDERLAGMSPDERLAGMSPDERLAGMSLQQILEAAHVTPESLLESLSPEDRAALAELLARQPKH